MFDETVALTPVELMVKSSAEVKAMSTKMLVTSRKVNQELKAGTSLKSWVAEAWAGHSAQVQDEVLEKLKQLNGKHQSQVPGNSLQLLIPQQIPLQTTQTPETYPTQLRDSHVLYLNQVYSSMDAAVEKMEQLVNTAPKAGNKVSWKFSPDGLLTEGFSFILGLGLASVTAGIGGIGGKAAAHVLKMLVADITTFFETEWKALGAKKGKQRPQSFLVALRKMATEFSNSIPTLRAEAEAKFRADLKKLNPSQQLEYFVAAQEHINELFESEAAKDYSHLYVYLRQFLKDTGVNARMEIEFNNVSTGNYMQASIKANAYDARVNSYLHYCWTKQAEHQGNPFHYVPVHDFFLPIHVVDWGNASPSTKSFAEPDRLVFYRGDGLFISHFTQQLQLIEDHATLYPKTQRLRDDPQSRFYVYEIPVVPEGVDQVMQKPPNMKVVFPRRLSPTDAEFD
ncbi:MAG TPA: hypothetical protein DCE41_35600, partial [Cytophagales bacterium]|nr:hypothetical protein [Cytophagales bacterium]HAP60160.1 hypothetical protein [Cytophagales bacterium]